MTLFYLPCVIYNMHLWFMAKMQKEEGWKYEFLCVNLLPTDPNFSNNKHK